MSSSVELRGTLQVGGDACASSCGGADSLIYQLGLRCGTSQFQSVVAVPKDLQIQTPGLPGDAFVDLDVLEDLTAIELLYLKSNNALIVRIGAGPAIITGVGGTFPTLFAGSETLNLTLDGVPFVTTFTAGDQTAAQCAARINAAAALAGIATPRAIVTSSGQLQISGILTGEDGSLAVTGGSGAATLGLTGLTAVGTGADVRINGTLLLEFDQQAAPARVQVSGNATLRLLAAGRSS